ncbi:thiolase family protein [Cytobacillus oceanisediminis]|uniref:acetyl-CoA C-acetyltransferase n=1 Tax=Cytobacillus oceanisediminis 2691 TaxID=1196031 RepID=A0A160MCH4_9BACI|nr:thiolase family protein [Cytobacillus oceanisediminis]AND40323.1 acetyl-CoA acetyltransferase [Cytobacillus oceanisediminis 2691]MCM3246245.1 thiolase family protein [Cytobacillus oceanisediminis]MCS0825733.1 thiolase family protein [Cytobacillus firmus]
MRNAVIIDGVRTAIGRMGGTLKDIEVDFLSERVMREALQRSQLDGSEVDEVVWGHAKQSSDVPNLARLAALRAGLPVEVPGYTVHRQCGSGLQAINNAAQQIQCGLSDIVLAGGGESMSTAPYYLRKARYGYGAGNAEIVDPNTESQPRAQPIEVYGNLTMGLTAENLAEKYNISREEQDEFALESQQKATAAIQQGKFKDEIIPYEVKLKKEKIIFDTDEHPRLTSLEKLGSLKPVFKQGGSVTAGNASGRNDGAAALVMMAEDEALRKGLRPRLRVAAQAAAGVSPEIMGIGPVPAVMKALKLAGLTLEDIDLIELNEAFAAQALAVVKELNIERSKLNVNGGAIALGHPIGGTGAILTVKIMNELERRGGRYGLITACIGGGQGIATIVENLRV